MWTKSKNKAEHRMYVKHKAKTLPKMGPRTGHGAVLIEEAGECAETDAPRYTIMHVVQDPAETNLHNLHELVKSRDVYQ